MGEYKTRYSGDNPETTPPKAVDVLAGIFEKYRKHSNIIPARPFDAAYWWMDHQEPAREDTERVESVTDKNGKVGWRTPYIDRVASSLRIFLSFNPQQQIFVTEKIDQGIPWRGDDIGMFQMICTESLNMAQDKPAYIQKASAIFQNFRTGVL